MSMSLEWLQKCLAQQQRHPSAQKAEGQPRHEVLECTREYRAHRQLCLRKSVPGQQLVGQRLEHPERWGFPLQARGPLCLCSAREAPARNRCEMPGGHVNHPS